MRSGSLSLYLQMCGEGVHNILLLHLVPRNNRCMHMVHVCCMTDVVTVWGGSVGMFAM